MLYSEREIGFSTGALAKGNFTHALAMLQEQGIKVVELSALRDYELPGLVTALPSLDLSGFTHISIHAPSKFVEISEYRAASLLELAAQRGMGIVVHPDTISDVRTWRDFGTLLWLENLDKRKPVCRTTAELDRTFEQFPSAGFCLDLAHARQIDPTMSEAARMLKTFGNRLRQVHASGLNSNSTHTALSAAAISAVSQVSHLVPQHIPIILESPIPEYAIRGEIDCARAAFSPWFHRLQSNIDDVIYFRVPTLRRTQLTSFLRALQMNDTRLRDFEDVIRQLPTGGPYKPGDTFQDTIALLNLLSPGDIERLKLYLKNRVEQVAQEFPDVAEQFKEQFT
jgi:hypothetical protein